MDCTDSASTDGRAVLKFAPTVAKALCCRERVKKRPREPAQLAKLIVDIATGDVEDRPPTPEELGKDPAAVAMGKKGGEARAKNLSAAKRAEIAKRRRRSDGVRSNNVQCASKIISRNL